MMLQLGVDRKLAFQRYLLTGPREELSCVKKLRLMSVDYNRERLV